MIGGRTLCGAAAHQVERLGVREAAGGGEGAEGAPGLRVLAEADGRPRGRVVRGAAPGAWSGEGEVAGRSAVSLC